MVPVDAVLLGPARTRRWTHDHRAVRRGMERGSGLLRIRSTERRALIRRARCRRPSDVVVVLRDPAIGEDSIT